MHIIKNILLLVHNFLHPQNAQHPPYLRSQRNPQQEADHTQHSGDEELTVVKLELVHYCCDEAVHHDEVRVNGQQEEHEEDEDRPEPRHG